MPNTHAIPSESARRAQHGSPRRRAHRDRHTANPVVDARASTAVECRPTPMADVTKTSSAAYESAAAKTATAVDVAASGKHSSAHHHRERAKPQLMPLPLSAVTAPHGQRTAAQIHSQEASRAFYQSTVVPSYVTPQAGESLHPHYFPPPHRTHWPPTHAPSFAWLPPSTPAPAPHAVSYPGTVPLPVPQPQSHYAPVPNPMWTPLHGHHHSSPYQYPQAAYAHYYPTATPQPPGSSVVHSQETARATKDGNSSNVNRVSKLPLVSDNPLDDNNKDNLAADKKSDPDKPVQKNDSDVNRDRSGTSGSDTAKQTESDPPSKRDGTNNNIQPPIRKARKPYTITKHREVWTEKEHSLFLQALQLFNRDWKRIESYIGTKTVLQIRSHAQKHFSKVTKYKTGEYIPPPRPKRRATRPYPRSRGVGSSSASNNRQSSSSSAKKDAEKQGASSKTAGDSGLGSSDTGDITYVTGKSNNNNGSGGSSEFTGTDEGGSSSVPKTRRPSSQPSSSPKKESRRRSSECLPPVPPPVPATLPEAPPDKKKTIETAEGQPPGIPPPQQQDHHPPQQSFLPGYNPYYYGASTPPGLPYAPGHHYITQHHPYYHPSMPPQPQAPAYIASYDGSYAQYPSQGLTHPGSHLHLAHPIQHQHSVHHHSQHLYHHHFAQQPTPEAPVAKNASPRQEQKLAGTATAITPSLCTREKETDDSINNNNESNSKSRMQVGENLPTADITVPANQMMDNARHHVWTGDAAVRRANRLRLIRAKKNQKGGGTQRGEDVDRNVDEEEPSIDVDSMANVEQKKEGQAEKRAGKPAAVASLLNSEPEEPRAANMKQQAAILVGTGGSAPANIPMNDEAVAGFSGSDGSDGSSPQEGNSRSGTPEEDPNSSSGDDGRRDRLRNMMSRGSSPTEEPNSGGSREDTPSAPDTNASQNNTPPDGGTQGNSGRNGNQGNGNNDVVTDTGNGGTGNGHNSRNGNKAEDDTATGKTEKDLKDAAKALTKYQTIGMNINSLLNNNTNGHDGDASGSNNVVHGNENNNNNNNIENENNNNTNDNNKGRELNHGGNNNGSDQKRGRSPEQDRRKNEMGTGVNLNMGIIHGRNNRNSDMQVGRSNNAHDMSNNDGRQWQRRKHAEKEDVMRER